MPGLGHANAIHPYATAGDETGRCRARLYHPRMPQPLVDALPIHAKLLAAEIVVVA